MSGLMICRIKAHCQAATFFVTFFELKKVKEQVEAVFEIMVPLFKTEHNTKLSASFYLIPFRKKII
jgi:hypothetical protein